jgi:hypothetical protein
MKDRLPGSYRLKAEEVSKEFIGDSKTLLSVKLVSSKKEGAYVSYYNHAKKEIRKALNTQNTPIVPVYYVRRVLHMHIVKNDELAPLVEQFINKVKGAFFDEICLFVDYKFVRKWV